MDENVILDPLKDLLSNIIHYLPQVLGALLVLVVGYFIVKAVEKLVIGLLKKGSFDRLIHRSSTGSYVAKVIDKPADLVGSIVFWVLWLGTLSIAVQILGIAGLTSFINTIYGYLPNVFAAFLIFLVAGAVSGGAAALATKLMPGSPTGRLVATVVPALTMTIAVFMILNQLGIAREIVTITYTALIGAVALSMALAFGLGGREVAARILDQAYESGKSGLKQARRDVAMASDNAKSDVDAIKHDSHENPLQRS